MFGLVLVLCPPSIVQKIAKDKDYKIYLHKGRDHERDGQP